MQLRQRPFAFLLFAPLALAAACNRPSTGEGAMASASALPSASAPSTPSAPLPSWRAKELGWKGDDALPAAIAALRDEAITQATALLPEARDLLTAVKARDEQAAWLHYAELRRRERALLPITRGMATVAASQMGGSNILERTATSEHAGFRAMSEALTDKRWDDAEKCAALLLAAARLMPGELSQKTWSPDVLGEALSSGIFEFGLHLDGSDARDQKERIADLRAEAHGLIMAAVAVREASATSAPESASRIDEGLDDLRRYLADLGEEPRGLLGLLRSTGKLGEAVRGSMRSLGAKKLRAPLLARRALTASEDFPVSVATFPRLAQPETNADAAQLGAALFASTLLSRNRQVACITCHEPARAFAKANPPALTFDRKVPARNAPGLLNVAYEPMHFWDGRASTLDAQIDIAVDRDMGGDWAEIERRIQADPALAQGFERAYGEAASARRIKSAIVSYERTLIADQTAFDRFERGESEAMDAESLLGFDLFFGKANCSRCHRLPLTSGVLAPRFLFTELSAIGVPTSPTSRKLDPDEGRAVISRRPYEKGVFKVPSLRNVALTAPYFHNGAFQTLEQVLDFYEKGGEGLGYEVPNRDPDFLPLVLSASERRALLAFLRRGLTDRLGEHTRGRETRWKSPVHFALPQHIGRMGLFQREEGCFFLLAAHRQRVKAVMRNARL